MARLPERFESETSELIKHFTGFKEGEKNYDICMDYALSNFNYHRFLDVNSHQVLRAVEGVYEKFMVQSQEEKARTFRKLCDEFLHGEVFSDHPTVEVQYGIISLLLNLSKRPTEELYDGSIKAAIKSEDADGFDWGRYLMENEENALQSDYSVSDLSDWSDDETVEIGVSKSKLDIANIQVPLTKPPIALKPVMMTPSLNETWRLTNVTKPYWLQVTTPHAFETNFPANVVHKCSPLSCTNVEVPSGMFMLSERQVIREILWLLQGLDTFLFQYDGSNCSLRKNVNIKYVTQQSFWKIVSPVVVYGNIIRNLNEFVGKAIGPEHCEITPRTYQAYASGMKDILNEMMQEINIIEKTVFDQKVTFTLSMALEHVTPMMRKFEILDRIHRDGVDSVKLSNPCAKACNLLNVLYEHSMELHLAAPQPEYSAIVTTLFLKTVKPYIDIIERWLLSGVLEDRCDEFVIQRKGDIQLLDERFWDLAVVLRQTAAGTTIYFLKPILGILVIAGKSMEILSRLGKLLKMTKTNEYDSSTLYDKFLEGILIKCDMASGVTLDPLLRDNIGLLEPAKNIERMAVALTRSNVSSVHEMLELSLFPRIESLHKHVSGNLIDILKRECFMNECLRDMRKYFLMEAGSIMHTFLSGVFKMSPEIDIRNEELSINMLLEDTFSSQMKKMPKIHIVMEDTADETKDLIHRLDPLMLSYELPWPLDIVINHECLHQYKRVFTFLMQIKHAKCALDELRFCDLIGDLDDQKLQLMKLKLKRMHILRMYLLNFVDCFHTYILTTVVRCSWLHFKKLMDNSRDLQHIIDAHTEFVRQIYERSFLSTNGSVIYKPVMNVLNQSLIFGNIWNSNIFNISEKSIGDIEKELNYTHKFLSIIVSTAMQKTHQPHMEALFVALVGSLPQQD